LDRRPEETALDLLQENQIGVLTRGSLAQGLLAGKPAKTYLNHSEQDVAKAAQAVQNLTTDKRSSASVAVQYVLHHPAVVSAVLGIRTPDQLEAALQVPTAESLSKENIRILQESIPPLLYEQHR
ncbi:MAG: aldo/keto reductase, partial [Bacteroidota bacterium]|nr:aldo/keto reductase [Bacteroidota bacterium]